MGYDGQVFPIGTYLKLRIAQPGEPFGGVFAALWQADALGFAGINTFIIVAPGLNQFAESLLGDEEYGAFHAAGDAGHVDHIGQGVLTILFHDVFPERMPGQFGLFFVQ